MYATCYNLPKYLKRRLSLKYKYQKKAVTKDTATTSLKKKDCVREHKTIRDAEQERE